MESAFDQLMPQIKGALARDATEQAPPEGATLAGLLPQMREALAKDEIGTGEEDVRLAEYVSQLLPRLNERLRQAHADTRGRLERDFPWALLPLDWDMDLLASLARARNEVTHTRCFAYLLDSRAPHGLGIRVLREFFRLLGRLIPGEDIFERLSNGTEESTELLRRVRVVAENAVDAPIGESNVTASRRCDVWLELVEEGRALVVVIENKIDAGEHDEQLASYEQAVWRWAREHRRNSFEQRLVFLTPEGRMPEGTGDHQAWLSMNYAHLAAALAQASRDAPEPGRTFLLLYVSTILKAVLGVGARVDETSFLRRLPYMREVIDQGEIHE